MSMAISEEFCVAEMVFLTLLSKYPEFIEGWIIIHLFYLKIGNYEGAQVSLQTAAKLKQKQKPKHRKSEVSEKSLSSCEGDSSIELEEAYKLIADGRYGMASYVKGVSSTDPLAWSLSLCPENNLYIRTAILLLRFNFFEVFLTSLMCKKKNFGSYISHRTDFRKVCSAFAKKF